MARVETRGVAMFFVVAAIGLVVAALCGAALSWDGGHYLFNILDRQAPFAVHDRIAPAPLHLSVLLAQRLTDNVQVLSLVFGLVYFSLPLLALALSWWMVRDRAPSLFVWPAFGIGLATLPGQLYVVTEAALAVQFFWPILLAIAVGMPREKALAAAVVTGIIFFCHPFALPLLGFAAGFAGLMGLRIAIQRRPLWSWGGGFAAAAALKAMWLILRANPYEAHMISLEVLARQFHVGVAGRPLAALVAAFFAGSLVWLAAAARRWRVSGAAGAHLLALTGVAVGGSMLLGWAADPSLWASAQDFRTWVLPTGLPFMILAAGEALLYGADVGRATHAEWPDRSRTVQLIAVVFALVLSVQAVFWARLANGLREAMAASSEACIPARSSSVVRGTALDDWSLTSFSILLQERVPQQVVLHGSSCAELRHADGLPISPRLVRPWEGGWFDFGPLFARLRSGAPATDCWLVSGSGWYGPERDDSGWRQWTPAGGMIRVVIDRDVDARLDGALYSIAQPNEVELVVNGTHQAVIETGGGFRPFAPITLQLRAPASTIELVSRSPAVRIGTDLRPLAFAAANLRLTSPDGRLLCQLDH